MSQYKVWEGDEVLLIIPVSEIKTQIRSYIKVRLFVKERENGANIAERRKKKEERE